jgi:catechol 2,3-dioxygenase-like lactoylglutathione lyase family enzyme
VDFKLELVVVPVSDVDRAKAFYIEKLGFTLDVDHRAGAEFRVVQLTPSGSACSITLMRNVDAAGSVHGLHLVVSDIEAARAELVDRGAPVSAIFHFESGRQVLGPDPQRGNYNSFLSFSDPDGNSWLVQEVRRAEAGA